MSRKKSQPKKDIVPDPKFNSTIIPKLINNLMYDGKRGTASKIVYDAIEKIKTKSKDEPINIFTPQHPSKSSSSFKFFIFSLAAPIKKL